MRSAAPQSCEVFSIGRLDSPPRGGRILSNVTSGMSISEFSRATYLSVRTLRHYDDAGLLAAEIDLRTGDRHHRPDQIGTARIG